MTDTTATAVYWDPFDTDIDSDPYDVWRRLRDEAPLYRNDRYDFWALSRFADVEAAHRDPVTFCSGHGTVLELMNADRFDTGQMIFVDPPEHTRLRALASRAFTPRRVSQLEQGIRDLCAELLDPHASAGSSTSCRTSARCCRPGSSPRCSASRPRSATRCATRSTRSSTSSPASG